MLYYKFPHRFEHCVAIVHCPVSLLVHLTHRIYIYIAIISSEKNFMVFKVAHQSLKILPVKSAHYIFSLKIIAIYGRAYGKSYAKDHMQN